MSLTENSAKKKLEQAKALIADVFSSRVLWEKSSYRWEKWAWVISYIYQR
jgi:hypothetical protein